MKLSVVVTALLVMFPSILRSADLVDDLTTYQPIALSGSFTQLSRTPAFGGVAKARLQAQGNLHQISASLSSQGLNGGYASFGNGGGSIFLTYDNLGSGWTRSQKLKIHVSAPGATFTVTATDSSGRAATFSGKFDSTVTEIPFTSVDPTGRLSFSSLKKLEFEFGIANGRGLTITHGVVVPVLIQYGYHITRITRSGGSAAPPVITFSHNAANPADVNKDGVVDEDDYYAIAGYLNFHGPSPDPAMFGCIDVSNDGFVSGIDQLIVLNQINSGNSSGGGTPPARIPGDSNNDGVFNSSDITLVFQAGEYNDGISNNSTWEEGDWNRDGDFDSGDFVTAFQAGFYVQQ